MVWQLARPTETRLKVKSSRVPRTGLPPYPLAQNQFLGKKLQDLSYPRSRTITRQENDFPVVPPWRIADPPQPVVQLGPL